MLKEGFAEKVGESATPIIKVGDKVEVSNYKETGIREGVYEVVNRVGSLIFLEGGRVMQDSWVEKGFMKKVGDIKQEKKSVDDECVLEEQGMMVDARRVGEGKGITSIKFSDNDVISKTGVGYLLSIKDEVSDGGEVLVCISDIGNLIKALELAKKLWGEE